MPCSSTRCPGRPPHTLPHSMGRACAGRNPCWLRAYGDLLAPMGTYRDLWEPMGTYGDLWGTYGDLWGHTGACGDLWGPMGACGDLWGPMGACGDLWGPMGAYGPFPSSISYTVGFCPPDSGRTTLRLDVTGLQRHLRETTEQQKTPLVTARSAAKWHVDSAQFRGTPRP